MKNLLITTIAALSLAGAVAAHEGHTHADEDAKKVTLVGEVVDLSCYVAEGERGPDHANCAKVCLTEKNSPAGLLTKEGKLYLLVKGHGAEKQYKAVCELGGAQSKVTGTLNDKGGLQAIVVEKVEKVEKVKKS